MKDRHPTPSTPTRATITGPGGEPGDAGTASAYESPQDTDAAPVLAEEALNATARAVKGLGLPEAGRAAVAVARLLPPSWTEVGTGAEPDGIASPGFSIFVSAATMTNGMTHLALPVELGVGVTALRIYGMPDDGSNNPPQMEAAKFYDQTHELDLVNGEGGLVDVWRYFPLDLVAQLGTGAVFHVLALGGTVKPYRLSTPGVNANKYWRQTTGLALAGSTGTLTRRYLVLYRTGRYPDQSPADAIPVPTHRGRQALLTGLGADVDRRRRVSDPLVAQSEALKETKTFEGGGLWSSTVNTGPFTAWAVTANVEDHQIVEGGATVAAPIEEIELRFRPSGGPVRRLRVRFFRGEQDNVFDPRNLITEREVEGYFADGEDVVLSVSALVRRKGDTAMTHLTVVAISDAPVDLRGVADSSAVSYVRRADIGGTAAVSPIDAEQPEAFFEISELEDITTHLIVRALGRARTRVRTLYQPGTAQPPAFRNGGSRRMWSVGYQLSKGAGLSGLAYNTGTAVGWLRHLTVVTKGASHRAVVPTKALRAAYKRWLGGWGVAYTSPPGYIPHECSSSNYVGDGVFTESSAANFEADRLKIQYFSQPGNAEPCGLDCQAQPYRVGAWRQVVETASRCAFAVRVGHAGAGTLRLLRDGVAVKTFDCSTLPAGVASFQDVAPYGSHTWRIERVGSSGTVSPWVVGWGVDNGTAPGQFTVQCAAHGGSYARQHLAVGRRWLLMYNAVDDNGPAGGLGLPVPQVLHCEANQAPYADAYLAGESGFALDHATIRDEAIACVRMWRDHGDTLWTPLEDAPTQGFDVVFYLGPDAGTEPAYLVRSVMFEGMQALNHDGGETWRAPVDIINAGAYVQVINNLFGLQSDVIHLNQAGYELVADGELEDCLWHAFRRPY